MGIQLVWNGYHSCVGVKEVNNFILGVQEFIDGFGVWLVERKVQRQRAFGVPRTELVRTQRGKEVSKR